MPSHRPEVSEVFRACTRLQPDYNSEYDQREQRASFCSRKNILDKLADFKTARVRECQKSNERQADELCRRKRQRVSAKSDRRDNVIAFRHPRQKHAAVACESNCDRCNCAGLNHKKKRPAVKESPQRRERFTKIHVLATG